MSPSHAGILKPWQLQSLHLFLFNLSPCPVIQQQIKSEIVTWYCLFFIALLFLPRCTSTSCLSRYEAQHGPFFAVHIKTVFFFLFFFLPSLFRRWNFQPDAAFVLSQRKRLQPLATVCFLNLAMKNETFSTASLILFAFSVLVCLFVCFPVSSTASNSPRSTPGSSPSLRRRVLGVGRASENEGAGEKASGGGGAGGGGGSDSPLPSIPSASSLTSAYPLASRHFTRNAKVTKGCLIISASFSHSVLHACLCVVCIASPGRGKGTDWAPLKVRKDRHWIADQ